MTRYFLVKISCHQMIQKSQDSSWQLIQKTWLAVNSLKNPKLTVKFSVQELYMQSLRRILNWNVIPTILSSYVKWMVTKMIVSTPMIKIMISLNVMFYISITTQNRCTGSIVTVFTKVLCVRQIEITLDPIMSWLNQRAGRLCVSPLILLPKTIQCHL